MIPPATQWKLLADHPEGTRHRAKIDIALPLLGEGLPPSAVELTLREKFPQATEREIRDVVHWCSGKHPAPCQNRPAVRLEAPRKPSIHHLLSGHPQPIQSPVAVNGHATEQLFQLLYAPEEFINIVCRFTTADKNGTMKANPQGAGSCRTCADWLIYFREHGIPTGEAGAWVRPNPVLAKGSGANGAITDADVTAFRFLLLESDTLPFDHQLALYQRLKLPISAILNSGGKSAHAWLRIDAATAEDYSDKAHRILNILAPLGFDLSNVNASRLSRLPGAIRKIGAVNGGEQTLLYLNQDVHGITEDEITRLTARVIPPRFTAKAFAETVHESMAVYLDIYRNKIRTGLRTGFPRFDAITGGLKRGWLTVIAGETNVGKSSFTLNLVNNVLAQGARVVLFSYEMDYLEINDILFSRLAELDRNKFNHGYFARQDWGRLETAAANMSNYHLDIYDDTRIAVSDMVQICQNLDNVALIVIDYLQMMPAEGFKDSREQQVASLSRGAKGLAKMMKCPVIALSQLNEEGKLRESRAIAHDANCVIVLEQDNGAIEARVIKGRSIPKGTFYFNFEPVLCRLTEIGCDEKLLRLVPQEEPMI